MALREVIETKGVFCSLYSDRAGHFFVTPKRGERVDQTVRRRSDARCKNSGSE